MKTVKDYKQLGLVFIKGDYINTHKGKKQSPLNRYGVGCCNGSSSNDDKFAIEFAWRNNDGVKPEYRGLIDISFECGTVSRNESAIDFEWSLDDENYIVKWRPVVFQSDNTHGNKDVSLTLPIGIDSPELREAFKSLKGHSESKPPFWNKLMQIFSCPCVAVNVEAIKPTVPPKEDKPMNPFEVDQSCREPKAIFSTESTMFGDRLRRAAEDFESGDLDMSISDGKPVYTAEMHAKGELPPVGSECILIVNNEPRPAKVTYIGKDIVCCSNIDGDAEYACLLGAVSFEPIQKTIKVNGFDVPAPMSEALVLNSVYFTPQTGYEVFYCKNAWRGDKFDSRFLSRGLVHSTESAAIAHAKAMLGIDPNA